MTVYKLILGTSLVGQWLRICLSGERGGESEMYGDSNMETYITICKIDRQREFAVCLRKLKQGLCINLEGWDREEDGREVQMEGYMHTYG